MMIEQSQTYTLTGDDVYQCHMESNGELRLVDLNRTRIWSNQRGDQGFSQGFLINGDQLNVFDRQLRDGQWSDYISPIETDKTISDLRPCGVEEITYNLADWSPEH